MYKSARIIVISFAFNFALAPISSANTDPFPGVGSGAEIPEYKGAVLGLFTAKVGKSAHIP